MRPPVAIVLQGIRILDVVVGISDYCSYSSPPAYLFQHRLSPFVPTTQGFHRQRCVVMRLILLDVGSPRARSVHLLNSFFCSFSLWGTRMFFWRCDCCAIDLFPFHLLSVRFTPKNKRKSSVRD